MNRHKRAGRKPETWPFHVAEGISMLAHLAPSNNRKSSNVGSDAVAQWETSNRKSIPTDFNKTCQKLQAAHFFVKSMETNRPKHNTSNCFCIFLAQLDYDEWQTNGGRGSEINVKVFWWGIFVGISR